MFGWVRGPFEVIKTLNIDDVRIHEQAIPFQKSLTLKGDGFSGDGTTELGPPIVELRDVTIRYGERTVLNRLSWIIREGDNWAVIGGNGAGKSTLIELITGDNLLAYTQDSGRSDINT